MKTYEDMGSECKNSAQRKRCFNPYVNRETDYTDFFCSSWVVEHICETITCLSPSHSYLFSMSYWYLNMKQNIITMFIAYPCVKGSPFLPGDKHSSVVVSDPIVRYGVTVAAPVLDGFLPLTEAV